MNKKTISPSQNLLWLYAVVCAGALYLVLFYRLDVMLLYLVLVVLCLFLLLDIFVSIPNLKNIKVEYPEVVNLAKNKPSVFEVKIFSISKWIRQIRLGTGFNKADLSAESIKTIHVQSDACTLSWEITGQRQGNHPVPACFLEIKSISGLCNLRIQIDLNTEFRVFPDLSTEKRMLSSRSLLFNKGIHSQRFIGKGRDFEHLREYLPGDLYEDIHWKATARRHQPVTKIFQIEKTQDVYVIIDSSRMSARNTQGYSRTQNQENFKKENILEKYIITALSTGLAAERQGDKFGIMVFSDQVHTFIPAGNRKSHFTTVRNALYDIRTSPATPDFTELITFIGNRIRKRALLILLTSLDDPAIAEGLTRHIHILSRKHLLMINMLKPDASKPLFSSPNAESTHDVYTNLAGHMVWHALKELERSLHRLGIGFFVHPYEKLSYHTISQYLNIKQRQAL